MQGRNWFSRAAHIIQSVSLVGHRRLASMPAPKQTVWSWLLATNVVGCGVFAAAAIFLDSAASLSARSAAVYGDVSCVAKSLRRLSQEAAAIPRVRQGGELYSLDHRCRTRRRTSDDTPAILNQTNETYSRGSVRALESLANSARKSWEPCSTLITSIPSGDGR